MEVHPDSVDDLNMQVPDHGPSSSSDRSWNYRAIRFEHGEDSHVAIHEVHYEKGRPVSYSETPAPVMWFAVEGPATGLNILERMREALEKPLLTEADFNLPVSWTCFIASGEKSSPDFGDELLFGDPKVTCSERLAVDPKDRYALDRELSDWDTMPAVGSERFWLAAANRYSFKTLMKLKRMKLGSDRPAKGSKEGKRARTKRFIHRHSP